MIEVDRERTRGRAEDVVTPADPRGRKTIRRDDARHGVAVFSHSLADAFGISRLNAGEALLGVACYHEELMAERMGRFMILLEPTAGPRGEWFASVVGLPVFAVARGRSAALRRIFKALELHLEVLRANGEKPPSRPRVRPEVVELQIRI